MTAERCRVLFVLEHYSPYIGGVETLFANLAEALAAKGHAVTVVTTRLPGTAAKEVRNGVQVRRAWVPPFARRYFFTLFGIPAAVREAGNADVIHTTTYNAAVPGWVAGRLRGVPAVLGVQEVFAEQWGRLPGLSPLLGWAFRAYEWFLLQLPFSRYVCLSEFTRGRLHRYFRVPARKSVVVYPAVDYRFWTPVRHAARPLRGELGLPADAKMYLYFGRPGVSKGVELLLDAAARVRQELPGSRLVLLLARSPASGHARIVQRIAALGLGDHVRVLDSVPREELPGYLLAADAVVVPSVSEGFGYAAVEAASLGCRVVSTAGHAVEEVMAGHATFAPPGDPTAMANAIIAAMRTDKPTVPAPPRYDLDTHVRAVLAVYGGLRG